MNRKQVKEVIEKLSPTIESITDTQVNSILKTLLNLIEALVTDNDNLRAENQQLRDEISKLKGEQGKPDVRKQSQGSQNFSSENERNGKKKKKNEKRKRNKKKNKIHIDRVEELDIKGSLLPSDAQFKGYHDVVIQDIIIKTDNVKFRKAVYYSPSLRKTFIAELPDGYQGEFGPGVKTLTLSLYHKSKMTESAVVDFFHDHNISIGAATVSGFLIKGHEVFHQEKNDIVSAGLASTIYQQMDDTSARVNGQNNYVHILCNELYTAYFTRERKDRLTILEILAQGDLQFILNETAFTIMQSMKLPTKILQALRENPIDHKMNRAEINGILSTLFPNPDRHHTNRRIILESTAIAAYRKLPHAVQLLLTDDAPQYNQITPHHPLCWVHEGRHYKKLAPVVPEHIAALTSFRNQFWNFYDKLLDYKKTPTAAFAYSIANEFDTLFAMKTGYDQLDHRIEKSKSNKDQLLVVLQHPITPIHNNGSELGARDQARRRDINLHTISKAGTESKDTFMTLIQTAKKQTVNFYYYVRDRVENKFEMPSLANLIIEKSKKIIFDPS
jgi:regulator of replication initiation timing